MANPSFEPDLPFLDYFESEAGMNLKVVAVERGVGQACSCSLGPGAEREDLELG